MRTEKVSRDYLKGLRDGKAEAYREITIRLLDGIVGAAFVSGLKGFNKALSEMKKHEAKSINTKTGEKKQ